MNSEFQFFPNVEPSGLAGGPRDTVCWLELWLWQSRRHKLVPRRAPVPSPASKRDRHTSTTSSSFHFPPICSSLSLTPSFDFRIWHFSLIVLSTNLGSTLATAREVLTFYSRPGVGWKSGKLVKLPMEITQVTAWDSSLHSNYKRRTPSLILYGTYKGANSWVCSVKRVNLQSNRITSSFLGIWLWLQEEFLE